MREDVLTAAINQWVGGLFDHEHVDETVHAFVDSHADATMTSDREAGKRRLTEAEQALSRFQDAIAAEARRDAVRAELANQPRATVLDVAEV